jgi:multidrug efflux pump subunit AcrA (membrane-fusion protein)
VFVAKKGNDGKLTASQRAVKLGPIKDNEYQVISGVSAGDQIVTSGILNLADGSPISPAS